MFICDDCAVEAIKQHRLRPHNYVLGNNPYYWDAFCCVCRKNARCVDRPDIPVSGFIPPDESFSKRLVAAQEFIFSEEAGEMKCRDVVRIVTEGFGSDVAEHLRTKGPVFE